jgi:hypothetical protein
LFHTFSYFLSSTQNLYPAAANSIFCSIDILSYLLRLSFLITSIAEGLRFLINPEGTVVAQEVQAPSVGRNVNEFLRQVKAWQHATATGEVCPAGWRPGKKTLPVQTDMEKMTGKVGDYITIEEILS